MGAPTAMTPLGWLSHRTYREPISLLSAHGSFRNAEQLQSKQQMNYSWPEKSILIKRFDAELQGLFLGFKFLNRYGPAFGKRLKFHLGGIPFPPVLNTVSAVVGGGGGNHRCRQGMWTPDGRFYVFQSARNGRYDLWSISEDHSFLGHESTSPVLLSSGLQGGYSFPVMGVNGQQIFAIGNQQQGELVRFDFRIREFVPFLDGISATWVTFANSGRSVAYIEYPDLTVWKANTDGSNKAQLTFSPVEVDGLS